VEPRLPASWKRRWNFVNRQNCVEAAFETAVGIDILSVAFQSVVELQLKNEPGVRQILVGRCRYNVKFLAPELT